MNFQQLCDAEGVCMKASHAVRTVGTIENINRMKQVEFIVAEVRHAGSTLCEPQSSPELRNAAVNRLISSLFSYL